MSTTPEYASFLIRIWHEASPKSEVTGESWHCEAEHIQSGRQFASASVEELLSFLRCQAEVLGQLPDRQPLAEPARTARSFTESPA